MIKQTPQTNRATFTSETQPNGSRFMRAMVLDRYGPARNFHERQVARPACGDEQVLVHVRAAAVNPIDWRIRNGSLRMIVPLRLPTVLGYDVSGEIVEVGSAAQRKGWSVGDQVISFLDRTHGGGYAEYAVASANAIARKPTTVPSTSSLFFQAATKLFGPRCLNILVRRRGADLQSIAQFVDEGKVRPVIQKTYPLNDVADAHLLSEAGHVRGKLVLSI